ncbi:hypothetical protein GGD81_004495 [Rhodobium orientis]|uniref:FeoB-associated Cys-rich membrane protein n=1 Tax=Rhodobium orientis TaxID=34017 RepID=A0A327JHA2_9HYPH|nr:FeoB-associated Cys-rich membrane protein [Rhodobium orientis]MBB4305418.1 hypothetical protein [Rhodobium orientis]MBK5948327.1 hypothetical protein [Rhodobium orientis]RAI25505.1 hypothetical protein CH339_17970 [Rhodobium orientis]
MAGETTATTEAPASGAIILERHEAQGLLDYAVLGLIVAAAVFYLYRRLWRRRGDCGGCGTKGCQMKPVADKAAMSRVLEGDGYRTKP